MLTRSAPPRRHPFRTAPARRRDATRPRLDIVTGLNFVNLAASLNFLNLAARLNPRASLNFLNLASPPQRGAAAR